MLDSPSTPASPSNYLPHRYIPQLLCYSGTHDNETLAQWLAQTSETARAYAAEYLGLTEQEGYAWGILRSGLASVADTFIAQLQDYLGLGAEARMNTPARSATATGAGGCSPACSQRSWPTACAA